MDGDEEEGGKMGDGEVRKVNKSVVGYGPVPSCSC